MTALSAEPPSRRAAESPVAAWFVPGRVEVLGKHTDYAGGRSLLAAVERGFCVAGRVRDGRVVVITRIPGLTRVTIELDPELPLPDGWPRYPAVVVRRLVRDFGITVPVELAFGSDLPPAAGLSSGTALTIGIFLPLAHANRLAEHPLYRAHLAAPEQLAEYLGCVENGRPFGPFEAAGGVGAMGGCEDQAAILSAVPGQLSQFRFLPVQFERRVSFPASHCFVIASSGVTAEKSGAARDAYNFLATSAAAIYQRWRGAGGTDPNLGDTLIRSPDALVRLRGLLAGEPALLARLDQFAAETLEIVPGAVRALEALDLETFGRLVDRSQAGAESGLRNQIPETIHLQRSARRLGAVAGSAFGAGFGGSVWAMVETAGAERFRQEWEAAYRVRFPKRASAAEFFVTLPGSAAIPLPPGA
ncbi:MAG: galactokinase family protein [Gemmatimonadales bacterium]